MCITDMCSAKINLLLKMVELGAKKESFPKIEDIDMSFHNTFIKSYPREFEEAKKQVLPSQKQLSFCNKLINNGALMNNSFKTSMYHADIFIKENVSVYGNKNLLETSENVPPSEWGGIPNH